MTPRRPAAHLALLLLGTLAGLVVIDVGLRAHAYLRHRGMLDDTRELPPDPAPGSRATLGQIIRRSSRPRLVYELRPGLRVVYHGGLLTTNSAGFRGADPGRARRPGTFRIVGLGDSFMFGQGVADEETHLALLARRLDESDPGTVHEAVNLAVPGYNAVMEVESLKERGLAYRPDLVLIEFIGNDADLPNFIAADPEVLSPEKWFLREFVAERLRPRRQRVIDGGEDLVEAPHRADDREQYEGEPSAVPAAYRDLVGWAAVERAYAELHALSLTHDFRVLVLRWESTPAEHRVVRLARRLGLATLNLSPIVEGAARQQGHPSWRDSPLVLGPTDIHPSPLGHRVVSEAVEHFLRERDLLRRRPG